MTTKPPQASYCRIVIRLVSLGIGLLFFSDTLWAQHSHVPERIPALFDQLPVVYRDLERQLLIDAADGLLNHFSLIDAGLIASGANTPYDLSQYRRRIKHIQQHATLSIPYLLQPEHQAAALLAYLHRHVLRRFETRPVTALDLWHSGKYNCITASWLYLILARKYDLPVVVVETPMHAYILLRTSPPVPIELTLPSGGFNFTQTQNDVLNNLLLVGLIQPNDLQTIGAETLFATYLNRQRELTPVQVLSVFFYNRALEQFEHLNTQTAFQYALAAHIIHPEDERYHRLTRDFGRAFATSLRRETDVKSLQAMTDFLQTFAPFHP